MMDLTSDIFYTDDISAIRDDLHQVTVFIKGLFPDAPLWLFGHSMGSLAARCYLKKYDAELSGLILCGPPTRILQLLLPCFSPGFPRSYSDRTTAAGS